MERQKMEQQNAENVNLMAINVHGKSEGTNLSKNVHANEIDKEYGKGSTLKATDKNGAQDSRNCSNQVLCAPQGVTSYVTYENQSNQEKQISSYVTSTPKKETRILDGIIDYQYEILPSQMILDDPLLSSVDARDLTDHINDDECEDSFTSFHETRMKSQYDNIRKHPLMFRYVNDIPPIQKVARSQSFSGTAQQYALKPDPSFVKKNLYDIPVSPKLKSRVRQRLFNLVNSIDGYKGQVSVEEGESIKKFTFKRIPSLSKKIQGTQTESNLFLESNGKSSKSASVRDNFGKQIISERNVNDNKDCKCHSQEFNRSNYDQQKFKSGLDQTSKSISETYESAISSMLETQMKTIRLHQEQLDQERFNSAVQKNNQEAHGRIVFYQENSRQMIQIMEKLELKISELQQKMKEQAEDYQEKIRRQDQRHKESLAMMRLECERKVQEAEYKIMSVREEVTKSSEQKIMEILLTTKEKSSLLEERHEAHVLQLNSVISKLKNSNLQHENNHPQKIIKDQEKNLSSKVLLEKEVILLRTQLQQSQNVLLQEHENFKTLLKKLAGELANNQEHYKQMMLRCQASLEKEESSAVSEAVALKQEETRVILTELKSRYENSLRNIQAHGRAQIDEYKKAVQFLKRKIKKMEEG